MKYIDAEKLIAEIERLNSLVSYENKDRHDEGLHDAYKAVKTVITSLQQEPRFPECDNIVEKVFGMGNLESFEYREAEMLVALAKEELLKSLQQEQPANMIQWTGSNLQEVIDFTGKSPKFGEWFKSWEDFENYVHSHDDILKLFCEDGSHYEVPVGAWIVKTPDGHNVPSIAKYIQQEQPLTIEKVVEQCKMFGGNPEVIQPEGPSGEDVMTMCNQILIDWVKEGKTQEEKEQREQAHIRFFELYDDYLMQEHPEIKSYIEELLKECAGKDGEYYRGRRETLAHLFAYLGGSPLKYMLQPVKQPEVDLEAEIERYEDEVHGFDSMSSSDCRNIARHFAEWGAIHLNARKED